MIRTLKDAGWKHHSGWYLSEEDYPESDTEGYYYYENPLKRISYWINLDYENTVFEDLEEAYDFEMELRE